MNVLLESNNNAQSIMLDRDTIKNGCVKFKNVIRTYVWWEYRPSFFTLKCTYFKHYTYYIFPFLVPILLQWPYLLPPPWPPTFFFSLSLPPSLAHHHHQVLSMATRILILIFLHLATSLSPSSWLCSSSFPRSSSPLPPSWGEGERTGGGGGGGGSHGEGRRCTTIRGGGRCR